MKRHPNAETLAPRRFDELVAMGWPPARAVTTAVDDYGIPRAELQTLIAKRERVG